MWKAEEAWKIAKEAQIVAEEVRRKEEAAKAAALHKEAWEANRLGRRRLGKLRRLWKEVG